MAKHGFFDFADLFRYVKELRRKETEDGGIRVPPSDNGMLRQEALRARRAVNKAKEYQNWHSQGWICNAWQAKQVQLLETGELETRRRRANSAYGFGQGADPCLTKEQAITLEVFTNQPLANYFD